MVNTYRLVNPHIEGSFESKIKAVNSNKAASLFYKNLSEHFNNSIPSFHFTIQKGSSGNGKYYHFKVNEKQSGNNVDLIITPLKDNNLSNDDLEIFKSKLDEFKDKINVGQEGGKKHRRHKYRDDKDSDSDSLFDSSEEFYKRARSYIPYSQPIHYWWYYPYLYDLDSIFIPTFYSYLTPWVILYNKS